MCELSAAKRRADRLEVKIRKIKALVEKASKQGSPTLQVRNDGTSMSDWLYGGMHTILSLSLSLQINDVKDILNAEIPNFKAVATVVQLANRASKVPPTTTNGGENPNSQACSVM